MANPSKPWLPSAAPNLLLKNVIVIDVESTFALERHDILISDGRFAPLGNLKELGDVIEIDLDSKHFICPGLIDCHVHLTATAGQDSMGTLFQASSNTIAYRTTWNAKQMLLRGFTTVRDTGGADYALREAIKEGLVLGPRLFIAGKALSQTGGHGSSPIQATIK